jgi:hypothetical protein
MFLATAALVFGQAGPPMLAKAAEEAAVCNLGSLPSDIQSHLKKDFGSWKIQDPENLSENARKTWAGRKPPACPGIAVGLFQNAKTASYAVLLVPVSHPDTGYRFLVFSSKAGGSSYEWTVVEQSNDHGASNYFIRRVPIGDFFDAPSKRKFQVQAPEGIEMIDSAEKEYGADIYFWSNSRFRQEPVDD